jgi:hypothetical protein
MITSSLSGDQFGRPTDVRVASSSSVRRSAPAAMFAARWSGLPVPGMASTCAPLCNVHARRTCAAVAPCAAATASTSALSVSLAPASRLRPRSRRTARTLCLPLRTFAGNRAASPPLQPHNGSAHTPPVRSPSLPPGGAAGRSRCPGDVYSQVHHVQVVRPNCRRFSSTCPRNWAGVASGNHSPDGSLPGPTFVVMTRGDGVHPPSLPPGGRTWEPYLFCLGTTGRMPP